MVRVPACSLLALASAQDLFLAQHGHAANAHCCYTMGCDVDFSTCSVGYCAESEANCEGCGGTFCPDDPSPAPTPSPPQPSPAPPAPAPPTPPSPSPAPPAPAGDIVGWYAKNWGNISPRPAESPNTALLFVGKYDFASVIQNCMGWTNDCKKAADDASVNHWIVVGGDTAWSKETIAANIAYLKANGAELRKAYAGVSYDIEVVSSTGGELVDDFAELLKASKDAGLGTMITTAWSGPMQADGYKYTTAWASDDNLDYLSPQIYSGMIDAPYSMANPPTTNACPKCEYEIFKDTKKVVVSIEFDGDYEKLKEGFFAHQHGYILWGN